MHPRESSASVKTKKKNVCFFVFLFFFSRHFLFKPGGTSPMYCTTSPGYPLTSSTVYSPPPRPLPRNTFSRPAFSLKKPYKHCNWKCAALSAILVSVTLLFLLAYFIGESPLVLPRARMGTFYLPPPPARPLAQPQTQDESVLRPAPSIIRFNGVQTALAPHTRRLYDMGSRRLTTPPPCPK